MSTARSASDSTLLASLTHLMARWGSTAVQVAVAADAGVVIDPADIPAVYMLGLEGPSRASDLAAALHLSRPTMSKQLSRLERAGLIERVVDPADGRATVIHLSPAGADAHRRLVSRGVTMLHDATADWDDDEAAHFAAQLARLVDRLSGPDMTASGTPTQTPGGEPAAGPSRPHPRSRNGGTP
ncbi:MarR family transcriptional regulator [Microbacterium aerolatum]|uniref:MarR family winged helix-turn-helix transcriptional regulator n=1 Tax=Microbacterium aerolatum TaxID=153731 RepID=UPI00384B68D7